MMLSQNKKHEQKPHRYRLHLANNSFEDLDKENSCIRVVNLDAKFSKMLRLLLLSIENI